ncbi:protein of unknown function [Alteromonadaceae bacterium Bs31]|nr:protein of unknown function [Alteromonadaceae bacterium Bs31]
MKDITGIGKVADSKLANKIYDDAGSPAVKQLGEMAADVTKTLRLFTAPFQLAALAQDRFSIWLSEVRNRVPGERQIEAPPQISGPALRAMLFLEENNPLVSLFVNLLSKAIDKESVEEVHPSFVFVLEQISADEALLLFKLREVAVAGANRCHHLGSDDREPYTETITNLEKEEFISPDQIAMYLEHLESMNLLRQFGGDGERVEIPKEKPEWENFRWFVLTEFGSQFLRVCVPDEFSVKSC